MHKIIALINKTIKEYDDFIKQDIRVIALINKTIKEYDDFIKQDIRVIGLEYKIENRLKTLFKVKKILSEHKELTDKQREEYNNNPIVEENKKTKKLLIDFSNFLKLELDKDFDNEFLVNEYISKSLNK